MVAAMCKGEARGIGTSELRSKRGSLELGTQLAIRTRATLHI